eukprot:jgi/Mesen1/3165/ME000184S02240
MRIDWPCENGQTSNELHLELLDLDWARRTVLPSVEGKEGAAAGEKVPPPPAVVMAAIPERWCSVTIDAAGGPVSVQNVIEAELKVSTRGGDVKIGKVKAESTAISTSGGHVLIDSRSLLHVSACAALKANGRSFRAENVKGDSVLIHAEGGDVHIGGLDGCAKVVTSGGNVELQLLQAAREVEVDSGGGDVLIYVPPTLHVQVREVGASAGSSQVLKAPGELELSADNADPSPSSERSEGQSELDKCCRVSVSTGGGKLVVKERGWMESILVKSQLSKSTL